MHNDIHTHQKENKHTYRYLHIGKKIKNKTKQKIRHIDTHKHTNTPASKKTHSGIQKHRQKLQQ